MIRPVPKSRLSSYVQVSWLVGLILTSSFVFAKEAPTWLDQIETSTLNFDGAVRIQGLKLQTGTADFVIRDGTFIPFSRIGDQLFEVLFLGEAEFHLDPPNAIEAQQLEHFTDSSQMREDVTEAVLVIASDPAIQAIFNRETARVPDADRTRAAEIHQSWLDGTSRELMTVRSSILRDALGDPFYASYFAGWFRGKDLGEFLYSLKPDSPEQVTLGQFTPEDMTKREKRRYDREINRQQRQGRLIGLGIEDLGTWDTWLSASLVGADGAVRQGFATFEPEHYELEIEIGDDIETLSGRARVRLRAQSQASRVAVFTLSPDFAVTSITANGEDAFFFRDKGYLIVDLPKAGEKPVEIVIAYQGIAIDSVEKLYFLRDTLAWYPHAGQVDRATYDVTLRWPSRLQVLAPGARQGGGIEGKLEWERRTIELPSFGYTFEIGKFDRLKIRANHVDITLAINKAFDDQITKEAKDLWLTTAKDAVEYYESTFGAYPLDHLTIVTTPRLFSQGLLSFVTLSSWMFDDRRSDLAHEIAHQWWGNMVGWTSYRDQWISEAMASYSAVLFARNKLSDLRLAAAPTKNWQNALLKRTHDGQPIETAGPVVLGARLDSSRTSAYQPIVYQKGAVVLDMIARFFGEEVFTQILRNIVQAVDMRAISTEDFLAMIEQSSGRELKAFADKFIYGTGLPEIYYSYDFEKLEEGWQVRGEASQHSPFNYDYQLIEKDGRLTIQSEVVAHMAVEDSPLVVPVQIAVYDPEHRPDEHAENGKARKKNKKKERGPDAEDIGNRIFQAHFLIEGTSHQFSWTMPYEPKEVWLDRDEEVFGRFFNRRRFPKRMLLYNSFDQIANGRLEEAEATLEEALEAEARSSYARESLSDGYVERQAAFDDTRVRLAQTRIYIETQRYETARQTLELAEELARRVIRLENQRSRWSPGAGLMHTVKTYHAWLAIETGDPETAFKEMRKLIFRRGIKRNRVSWLLLAIGAHHGGHQKELDRAITALQYYGIETSLLES